MKVEFDLDNAAECAKVLELLGGEAAGKGAKKTTKTTKPPSELDDEPGEDEEPTLEDIQKKVAEVKTSGKKAELTKLYTKYKIQATTDLKAAKFVAFMADLEAIAD